MSEDASPPPPERITLRGLVDRIVEDIKGLGGPDSTLDIVTDADIRHKYYSLHGGDTPGSSESLSELEFGRLLQRLGRSDRAEEYRDLYRRARAYRQASLTGETPSFYHMDLHKPTKGCGWLQSSLDQFEAYGAPFAPPTLANINTQLDVVVHRVRADHGDIAALNCAYV